MNSCCSVGFVRNCYHPSFGLLRISISAVVYSEFKPPRFSPWLTVNQADNSCISRGLAVSTVESGRLIQGWWAGSDCHCQGLHFHPTRWLIPNQGMWNLSCRVTVREPSLCSLTQTLILSVCASWATLRTPLGFWLFKWYARDLDLSELIQEQLWKLKILHFFYSLRCVCVVVGPLGSQHQDPALSLVSFQVHIIPTVLILELLLSKY